MTAQINQKIGQYIITFTIAFGGAALGFVTNVASMSTKLDAMVERLDRTEIHATELQNSQHRRLEYQIQNHQHYTKR